MIEAEVPYNITGPHIIKIFAPSPKIHPSDLNSIAGDTTEFAKPVIGTRVPAPPSFPILGYILRPFRSAEINIKATDAQIDAVSRLRPASV